MKTTKHGPGSYSVYSRGRTAQVLRNPMLCGAAKWIAYAEWDRYCVTDPVLTYREARALAQDMIIND